MPDELLVRRPPGRPRKVQPPLTADEILARRQKEDEAIKQRAAEKAAKMAEEIENQKRIDAEAQRIANEIVPPQFTITHRCSQCKRVETVTGESYVRRHCCKCMMLMSVKVVQC